MTQIQPISAFDVTQFRPALMPGESADTFDNLYAGLCAELLTPSPLARVLCAQLAEAMIWYQRHQRDKRAIIIDRMVTIATEYFGEERWRLAFFSVMDGSADDETHKEVEKLVATQGYTLDALASVATVATQSKVADVEKLIDRQAKIMRQLQKGIAEVEARPLIVKRLALQVEQLTRDAQALAHDNSV